MNSQAMLLVSTITSVSILEKRYLCFLSWEQISVDMHYSMQYTFKMHDKALTEVEALLAEVESKVD